MRALLLSVSLVLVAAIGGCAASGDSCTLPLSSLCQGSACRTYDQSVADARALAASGHCFYAVIGTSGPTRFVQTGEAFGGSTTYFDTNGQVVGATGSSDTNSFCNGTSFSQSYGNVPKFEQKITETLCLHGSTDLGGTD